MGQTSPSGRVGSSEPSPRRRLPVARCWGGGGCGAWDSRLAWGTPSRTGLLTEPCSFPGAKVQDAAPSSLCPLRASPASEDTKPLYWAAGGSQEVGHAPDNGRLVWVKYGGARGRCSRLPQKARGCLTVHTCVHVWGRAMWVQGTSVAMSRGFSAAQAGTGAPYVRVAGGLRPASCPPT